MARPLWQWNELVTATRGQASYPASTAAPNIAGISIDTRTIEPGDMFVALKDARDGHDFVTAAFTKGAAAALVDKSYRRRDGDGTLLHVKDPLAALEAVARVARARLASSAKVIAVTGSAGKTGTKEMLRACLATAGKTHASDKSYNNHWGVPLTLARMPSDSEFAVIEIGMNHPGEITPLTKMARPHVAIITNVLPVHLGQFASVEEIAEAKAEILLGLEPGGVAILNADNPYYPRLAARASALGHTIRQFGRSEHASVRVLEMTATSTGTRVQATVAARGARAKSGIIGFDVGAPGEHLALNAVGVLAILDEVGAPLPQSLNPLRAFTAPVGRGARMALNAEPPILLIDESYNANPASVKAALAAMGTVSRAQHPRRIAVLGQMLELGLASLDYHLRLADAIEAAGIDLVLACGADMRALVASLPERTRGAWTEDSQALIDPLLATVRPGDVVMIKGSLGTRMAPLVEALKRKYGS